MCGLLVALVAPVTLAACGSESAPGTPSGSTGGGGGSTGGGGTLAKLADVPVGGGAIVDGPSGKVLLVRSSETEVKGFDPTCPHAGVTVKAPSGGTITCPGHGSQFDGKSGGVKKGPAGTGLNAVAVKISGDSIVAA
jgi:nitrite reductase/ring-hydroxylating ferredoxin subunit